MEFLNSKYNYYWVFLFSFALCLFGSNSSIIYILDEAKNSEAAREMLLNGDYFKPTFNNIIRTDKPPFHYFFMMIGYKIFGVNALGARFFSSIFGALTVLITFVFTKKHLGKKIAQTTFGVLMTSFYFIQEFHLAVPDPYLIFWISLSFFSYIDFYITQQKRVLLVLYSAIGLGVLTKGPIAVLMPGLVALIHLLLTKSFKFNTILKYKPVEGVLLVLLLSVPWFYFAHLHTNGVFTDGFFFKHNISRFQNKMEGHGGLFLITIGYVILGMFPFSIWLFRALWVSLKEKKENVFVFYSAIVSVVFIAFFAVSATKLPNYTMPCYPFIAIVLGWWLRKIYKKALKIKFGYIEWAFLLLVSIAIPISGYIGLSLEQQLKGKVWLSFLLLIVPFGVITAFVFYVKSYLKKSFLTLVYSFVTLSLVLFGVIFPQITKETPVEKYKEYVDLKAPVLIYKKMDAAFPINFNKTYRVVDSIEEVDSFFKSHPNGVVMTNSRNKKELHELKKYHQVFAQKSLFENHTTRVYSSYSN